LYGTYYYRFAGWKGISLNSHCSNIQIFQECLVWLCIATER